MTPRSQSRPIFLVGCARSGTTLLSVMLHAHPRIAMPPETSFLIRLYRDRARFGDLTVRANRRKLARAMTSRGARFGDLGLDRQEIVRSIVAGPPTYGSAAGAVWRGFARSRGKARWGEKRPAYWSDMDVVLRLFPDAQVIHLVRDGRACVASLKQMDWYDGSIHDAMVAWSLAERELTRVGHRLPADSYHHLRYEDLLADPRCELQRLCGFLGEDFDEGMLDYSRAAGDIVPERKTWHDRTRGEIDVKRIEAWQTTLTAGEIGLVEAGLGNTLQRNGYQLSGAGTPPTRLNAARYRSARAQRSLTITARKLQDLYQRRTENAPLVDLG